jgi:hypothetical protein
MVNRVLEEMNHELEILEYSYWEHFKHAKDISLILPVDHPKRKSLEIELNSISKKMQHIKSLTPKK